jgi:uncharacterized membrane protein YesL
VRKEISGYSCTHPAQPVGEKSVPLPGYVFVRKKGLSMNSFFNYDNKFSQIVNKIVNIFFISVLWLIWCIPIVTFGASTTAMYYTVNKVLRHNRSYVFTEFWGSFKRNFKQATLVWLILLVFGIIMWLDAYIMKAFYEAGSELGKFFVVFYVMMLFEVVLGTYIFANIARFENTTKEILKNSALMALAHLPWSLLILVLFVLAILLDIIMPPLILILPTIYMWMCNLILERIFRKYMSEDVLKEEDERNRDYYG